MIFSVRKERGLLIALAFLLICSSSVAAPGEEEPPPEEIEKNKAGENGEKISQPVETIVVTAARIEQNQSEIPDQLTVISAADIERTLGFDLTDVLKKYASVDVVQYPGALSSISIRGFQPEIMGLNRRHLLLVDGRPAGTTNLATIALNDIERIEVLKGPASALYGGQAMGGVINVITRRSVGDLSGRLQLGVGSFETYLGQVSLGGSATDWLDFDVVGGLDVQREDATLGNGKVRPHTTFKKYNGSGRLGVQLGVDWRLEARGSTWAGRDIQIPGDEAYGDSHQGSKDVDRLGGDLSVDGEVGNHSLSLVGFASNEMSTHYQIAEGGDPFRSYATESTWLGVQIRDAYLLAGHALSIGLDVDHVEAKSRSYDRSGARKAPWGPNSQRNTFGLYADGNLHFLEGDLVAKAGLRWDHIQLETLRTPYKTDFTPGSSAFDTLNPRAGLSYSIVPDLRLHTTVGRAFVPPAADEMAGYAERKADGVVTIVRGNADLDSEASWTVDAGVSFERQSWGLSADFTYFFTAVSDKIELKRVSDSELVYTNYGEATIHGYEARLSFDVGTLLGWKRSLRLYANLTQIIQAEEADSDGSRDIHNVADIKANYGVEFDDRRMWAARLNARYRGETKDYDWTAANVPEITCPDWVVLDLVVHFQPVERHRLTVEIGNLLDQYYAEKKGYALPGRTFFFKYAFLL